MRGVKQALNARGRACLRSSRMKKNLKTPTNIVGKRRHGFRSKMANKSGRKLLKRRRQKGRKRLTI